MRSLVGSCFWWEGVDDCNDDDQEEEREEGSDNDTDDGDDDCRAEISSEC